MLDPDAQTAYLFDADRPPRAVGPGEELGFPEPLGAFRVVVRRLFE